jgi:hypothetical protein
MWIESHQSLRNHPKVKKAARMAGVNEFEMIGRLHCLWWWALDYAPDGDLTNYSDDDIEAAVDWQGERGAFAQALIECGFNGHGGLIDVTDDSRTIHDWYDYGGKLLERRETNKERMREARSLHVQNTQRARVGLHNRTEQTEQTKHAGKPRSPSKSKDTCPKEWIDKIATVCKIDSYTASMAMRKNVSDCGRALIKGGAALETLDLFERNWYALDWRGKQGQPPTVKQVRDEWGKYSKESNGNGQHAEKKEIKWLE